MRSTAGLTICRSSPARAAAARRFRPRRRAPRSRRRPSSARRCLPAASTTLAPAPAAPWRHSAPKAPDAPVTIAVLPRTSNRRQRVFEEVFGHGDYLVPTERSSSWPGVVPGDPGWVFEGRMPGARDDCLRAQMATVTSRGGSTATAMVQTSLLRLTISRLLVRRRCSRCHLAFSDLFLAVDDHRQLARRARSRPSPAARRPDRRRRPAGSATGRRSSPSSRRLRRRTGAATEAAMVRRLVRLRVGKFADDHQNVSPLLDAILAFRIDRWRRGG